MRPAFPLATALALSVAATCASAAAASEQWVSTRTLKHDVGSAAEGVALRAGETVQVSVTLRMRNQGEMDALTEGLLSGRSSRHITPAEFLERFAPTAAQAQAVVEHLRRAGFVDIEVAPNRMLVSAHGTAAAVKGAFRTELRHFTVEDRDAFANVADAQVPARLGGIVNAVLGLQTVHLPRTMLQVADAQAAAAGAAVGHNPTQFPAIYNASGLPTASTGTVGIITAGDVSQTVTDLQTFAANSGYPAPNISTVIVGTPGSDTSGTLEWNMDSQVSLAAAGGTLAGMTLYVATSLADAPLTAAYNRAVSDNTARAINVSLGECETAAKNSGVEASDDAIFQIAVALGQAFSVSSGDSGSFQCGSKKGGQSYPAVSPYVIAVGGTKLFTSGGTTWTNETTWACSGVLGCELLTGGTGGGASKTEKAPSYQLSSGVIGTSTMRGMPDIAFDADPNSGALVLQGSKTTQVGGTSLAAPLFTGFWTRIQAQNGNTLGFPAPGLYKYGPTNSSAMFHDVTAGSNGGYSAKPGWDYVTGFGTLDVGKFASFVAAHPGDF